MIPYDSPMSNEEILRRVSERQQPFAWRVRAALAQHGIALLGVDFGRKHVSDANPRAAVWILTVGAAGHGICTVQATVPEGWDPFLPERGDWAAVLVARYLASQGIVPRSPIAAPDPPLVATASPAPIATNDLGLLSAAEIAGILGAYLPSPLPDGWRPVETGVLGASFRNHGTKHMVIVSARRESDGRRWLHVSTSFPNRVPTYRELCWVKQHFIGDHHHAVQCFVPKSEHVNIHPYTLHLWHCIDGRPLPDFRVLGLGAV